jgi:hypothetical protein
MERLARADGSGILGRSVRDEQREGTAMARKMSRRRLREAFLLAASGAFERLEAWYDAHSEATFGEIEQEARRRRRELRGKALEVLVNGRDNGVQVERPKCE